MQTMIVYDDLGEILSTYYGREEEEAPVGVNSIVLDVPVDYILLKIDVTTNPDSHTPVYEYQAGSTLSEMTKKITDLQLENENLSKTSQILSNNNRAMMGEVVESVENESYTENYKFFGLINEIFKELFLNASTEISKILRYSSMLPSWDTGLIFYKDDYVTRGVDENGFQLVYQVLMDHMTKDEFYPENTPSIYVLRGYTENIREWVEPFNYEPGYDKDVVVPYNGKWYKSWRVNNKAKPTQAMSWGEVANSNGDKIN